MLAVPIAVGIAMMLSSSGGCIGDIAKNLTKERQGDINVQFINETSYNATFTFGTYDAWDRTPGAVTLQQYRVVDGEATDVVTVTCRRNFAIGTEGFVQRVVDTDGNDDPGFQEEWFDTTVHFSNASSDVVAGALPTVGTAEGLELLLGIDFSCNDLIIITFVEDAQADGGFRIDYEVIRDVDQTDP